MKLSFMREWEDLMGDCERRDLEATYKAVKALVEEAEAGVITNMVDAMYFLAGYTQYEKIRFDIVFESVKELKAHGAITTWEY